MSFGFLGFQKLSNEYPQIQSKKLLILKCRDQDSNLGYHGHNVGS